MNFEIMANLRRLLPFEEEWLLTKKIPIDAARGRRCGVSPQERVPAKLVFCINYKPCSFKNLSASSAAAQPVPAEVIAWRYLASATSPAAKIPGTEVAVAVLSAI